MASIVLTGLSSSNPQPGVYEQINFAVGPASGATKTYPAVILANFLPAGSATAATIYGPDTNPPVQTETDVINTFGTGSEMHRMFLKWTAVNKSTALYMVGITQSGGAQASLTTTLSTVPTAAGTVTVYMNDESVQYSFASGDALATTIAGIVAQINNQTRWPITASAASPAFTVTANQAGPRGNYIQLQVAISPGTSMTTTNGTKTVLAGGTTADSNTNALAAILPSTFYYIVSAAEDASQFGAVNTQVLAQALPTIGIRQRCFAGSTVAAVATVNTIATGINSPRAEIIWQQSSDWTPAELAASAAAIYALLELPTSVGGPSRHNFSLFPASATDAASWLIPGTRARIGPTSANIQSALANGVTPIALYATGASYLVKRITTRSLNGAVNDYRIRDAHKVTISDFFGAQAATITSLQFGGKDLENDIQQGQPPPGPLVVTPSIWGNALKQLVTDFANDSPPQLQNASTIIANMVVQRETSPTTRMSARIPLTTIDIADQFCLALDQVG